MIMFIKMKTEKEIKQKMKEIQDKANKAPDKSSKLVYAQWLYMLRWVLEK